MTRFNTVEDVLDFAIAREEDACALYRQLAEDADNAQTRDMLLGFAAEEVTHQIKLKAVKNKSDYLSAREDAPNMIIDDYLMTQSPTPDMSFKDTLTFAMQCEKKAFSLYLDLSESTPNPDLKDLFKRLAQEEISHDDRFESVYKEAFSTN